MPSELVKTIDFDIRLDEDEIRDPIVAWHRFIHIVGNLPGIVVLRSQAYRFPDTNGWSGVILIAESHAAIHTWPERGTAWVELATCGDPRALDAFAQAFNGRRITLLKST